ncbi:unnamed protein product [Trichobilharzia szidati]|nr:unnamed protein product [Trichobilharzia szidati]
MLYNINRNSLSAQIHHNLQVSKLCPGGIAVARLPNRTYATVSLSSTGMSGSTPIFVNNTPIPSTLANPVDTSNIPRRNTPTSRSKQKTE